jgi:hypothetical protein
MRPRRRLQTVGGHRLPAKEYNPYCQHQSHANDQAKLGVPRHVLSPAPENGHSIIPCGERGELSSARDMSKKIENQPILAVGIRKKGKPGAAGTGDVFMFRARCIPASDLCKVQRIRRAQNVNNRANCGVGAD